MKSILLSSLLLLVLSVFSQDSVFQIKNYQYRTPGFQALAVNFNFAGSLRNSKEGSNDESTNRNLSLGPASISYVRVISTDTRLHESSLTGYSFAALSGHVFDRKEAVASQFHPQISWHRNDRYYKKGNWFFELGNQVTTGYQTAKRKDTAVDYSSRSFGVNNKLTVGIGKGRVERVQDAQMALYILEDLSAQGLLNKPVTAEQVNALAQLITDINNQRVFDFRRRRIYELTRIDSFLRGSGLTGETTIRHFSTINDNWAYAFNPYRLSGANWFLRFQPSLDFARSRNTYVKPLNWPEQQSETSVLELAPVVGYENFKPVSLQWQRNYGASLSYAKGRTLQQFSTNQGGTLNKWNGDFSSWWSEFNGFYGIGFFPNNRTQINSVFRLEGAYSKEKHRFLQSSLNLDVNYFVGYRTYLSAVASLGYTNLELTTPTGKTKTRNTYANLSVTLSHVLF